MAFPPDEAKLVSIFCQTLLYGAYVVLFFNTTWTLLIRRPPGQPLRKGMLLISLLMFVIATMHIGTNFTRIIKAFIIFRNEPGGPAAFFSELSEFTQMFGSTLYVLQTLLGDAIVLLRCYLVWEKRIWVVVFPSLLLLGSTATGIGILYAFDHVNPEANIFVIQLSQWITSFFTMTFATNVICTALVAYRIYAINTKRLGFSIRRRRLQSVMFLIVESGAIYSAALMTLLILYEVDSWFQYVILDSISPTVGIVFSVIMLRIATGVTTEDGETALMVGEGDIRMSRRASDVDSNIKSSV